MSLVLDSSVTLAWLHPDEARANNNLIFEQIAANGAWVPGLWRLEVANVLEMGIRRGRYDRDFVEAVLTDLSILPIHLDPDTDKQAWGSTARLAARHRLTLYDAAYLELALRRSLPLASIDKELRTAARTEGVELLAAEA
jgi:predicted nucleic acid-binding protein